MITKYFTFGQIHSHTLPDGRRVDKDTILKITAPDPTQVMFDLFGPKWSMEYSVCPNLTNFPKGVIEL